MRKANNSGQHGCKHIRSRTDLGSREFSDHRSGGLHPVDHLLCVSASIRFCLYPPAVCARSRQLITGPNNRVTRTLARRRNIFWNVFEWGNNVGQHGCKHSWRRTYLTSQDFSHLQIWKFVLSGIALLPLQCARTGLHPSPSERSI